jgi:thioredoxin-related protein
MSKVYQKLEMTANILIIVVSIILIGFFVQRYLFVGSAPMPTAKIPVIGKKLAIADVDFSKSSKNVFLVLSKGCHFCSESAEFYKKLIAETKGSNINLIAILPQEKKEAEEYLNGLGIQGIEIRQSQLNSLDVSGTPTILVLDNNGEVSNYWTGKLPPSEEKEVFDKLNS